MAERGGGQARTLQERQVRVTTSKQDATRAASPVSGLPCRSGDREANAGIRCTSVLIGIAFFLLFAACQKLPFHTTFIRYPILSLLCIAAALPAAFAPVERRLRGWVRAVLEMPHSRFVALLFGVSLLINLVMSYFVFRAVPRLDDGVGALFQARIFARFQVTLPLPPNAEFFEQFGVLGDKAGMGHWCGMYPPGWPALLTPGVWLGMPWAVAPLLGSLLLVTIVVLGREMFDSRTGRIAGLLGLLSPFIVVLSGMHLSHVPTGLFMSLCLLALLRLLRTDRWSYGIAAGLAYGMALLCRPLTAAVVGACFGVVLLFRPRRVLRNWCGIAAAAIMVAIAVLVYLLFQKAITGDMFLAGHVVGMGRRGKFGFVRLDSIRTHTPVIAAMFTGMRIRALNDNILGWPVPSLLVAVVPFILGRRGVRYFLLLLPLPALLAVYACYWYYESYFPARYTFAAVPLVFILCARMLILVDRLCRKKSIHARRIFSFAICSSLLFLVGISTPLRVRGYDARFGDVEGVLPKVIKEYAITNAVVFMDSKGKAEFEENILNMYYATGFMRNDLDLENDVIYVHNLREHNPRMLETYPDRSFFLYRYLRHRNKACLYRIEKEDGEFTYVPVEPRGRHMHSVPNFRKPVPVDAESGDM